MHDQPTIWHNPRCSKSRQTLELLRQAGYTPQIINYLDTPPDAAAISDALGQLELSASQLIRRGEAVYKELELTRDDDKACLAAMAKHPILIERPVVFYRGKAALGRPPEQVMALLD